MATRNFFRNPSDQEHVFFDEGPRPIDERKPRNDGSFVNTSSIDTSGFDAYRQGVELTQQKFFDAGIAKIHAGEPGHALRRNRFGMDRNFRAEPNFEEMDYFNPETYLRSQDHFSDLNYNIITFPIITSDNDQLENYIFDGVIEPFTIRSRVSFFSIDVPFEAHETKGALIGGNSDSTLASDQVLTVDYFEPENEQIEYLDMVDMIDGRYPLNGYFRNAKSLRRPFTDERLVRNVLLSSLHTDLNSAMSLMTGSTDNYIISKKRSASAGWDYDCTTAVGTDSIAFGGMCY